MSYKDRCAGCMKPLCAEPGQYVTFKTENYHVGCLLDLLCNPRKSDISVEPWGYDGCGGSLP